MVKKYPVWVLALAACLVATPAVANEGETAYVFISAGQSAATNACQSGLIPLLASFGSTASCAEKSVVYRGGFGYQFTPMWGLEVSYGQFGYAGSDGAANFPGIGTANYSWQLKAIGWAVQGTVTLPVWDDLSVIGKVGMAQVEFDEYLYAWNTSVPAGYTNYYFSPVVNAKKNSPAVAAGVQYDVTPRGSIRLMVESMGSADIYSSLYGPTPKVRLTAASLGLLYRY